MPQARGFRQFGISFADYKVSIRNKWDGRGGMATLIPALGSCAGRMQTQCAGEQRLNANAHLAILLSKKHRPVDLWTTRIAELPTSPTGLHYDGFSLSNSTRNDEEPGKITRVLQIWCIFVVVSKDLSGDQLLYLKELAALDEDFGVREDVVNRINAKVDSTP